jgi:hypothetical protein
LWIDDAQSIGKRIVSCIGHFSHDHRFPLGSDFQLPGVKTGPIWV